MSNRLSMLDVAAVMRGVVATLTYFGYSSSIDSTVGGNFNLSLFEAFLRTFVNCLRKETLLFVFALGLEAAVDYLRAETLGEES